MRTTIAAVFLALGLATACGGGGADAEATWETHSTAPDDGAGGEDPAE
ncbi:MAG: hypothetical protein KF729_37475 [Sandaracinaceae bacterium]|nr:hypothetical protein [Sandaracinaceae bacterium]